jgi:MFS family permease
VQCYQVRDTRHDVSTGVQDPEGALLLSSFFFGGLMYSWGIVQARLIQSQLASVSQLSFIGSTGIALISVAALINVRLIRWLGTRKACTLGCFFLGLGPLLNGFATKSYGGLFVTNGLILGFGTSLSFMVSDTKYVSLSSHF